MIEKKNRECKHVNDNALPTISSKQITCTLRMREFWYKDFLQPQRNFTEHEILKRVLTLICFILQSERVNGKIKKLWQFKDTCVAQLV